MKQFIRQSWHWIVLLFTTDAVFVFVTWLIRREAIRYMLLFLLLFTLIALTVGLLWEFCRRRKDESILLGFLEEPNDQTKEAFLQRFGNSEAARTLCTQIISDKSLINEKNVELSEYRDYIEAWVHEVKTPLSLSALVLGNHKDEMSPYVYSRMKHIEHQLNEDTERILYYARLQADHSDIRFAEFRLDDCVREVLDIYRTMMEEKSILLEAKLQQAAVISDRKVTLFMLSQMIGNAVKYADASRGKIFCTVYRDGDKIHLAVYNNGEGVATEDAPFIFDKGFTGNYPNRQKATGMGLYLVRKYADKLCAEVKLTSQIPFECGFGIELIFTL